MLNEAAVRDSLRREILTESANANAVYEFWVPRTNERADVVRIGEALEGFEIKTERDRLDRLPRQALAYARVFDRCHAVIAHRHVDRAIALLPPWWGIRVIEANEEVTFSCLREAGSNCAVDAETLVRLLWREEASAALGELGVPPDPYARRGRMWQSLLSLLDLDELKTVVREALLRRDPAAARIPSRRFVAS
ncbi:sce7726 family protein [Mycolicibacterium wolinskyi]|uniref:sce7726 family protein n=1 Tax=Mycolicibacterium TaxID=1866885 RepID=UPI0013FE2002|nr:sce7726 family protein [Mycolicibacterium wolinskyi]MCV7297948.1 sce7726 family protein [Mycolicibacterium goodii]